MDTSDTRAGTSRRSVLAAAGGLGIATLAGCATYGDTGGGGVVDAPGPGAPAGGATGSPGTGGTVLGPADAVPVGGGQVFGDQGVVVTRPADGTYLAFTAVCTHAGCLVANVSGGTINCTCHGSKFDATTGAVVNPPAPQPLRKLRVTVADGQLVLPGS
ncbi:hypothetical protein GCM10009682_61580 [Luedemannella flava]|uniref:Cytochrome bc1 complex Rieske iron-sulfur subunit n=1 Tax=Luedemannella flava TaxID=349316 RepID=A0ABP4YYV8_9ACTN